MYPFVRSRTIDHTRIAMAPDGRLLLFERDVEQREQRAKFRSRRTMVAVQQHPHDG